jgi:D-alanyl-D-alanine carboxypeptidase/D-alanyl-D-alanine-endopeptidase (penicillin-binding protein 4)
VARNNALLNGNMVVQGGGGDPESWWPERPGGPVDAGAATGARAIRGDIVLDCSAFAVPATDWVNLT